MKAKVRSLCVTSGSAELHTGRKVPDPLFMASSVSYKGHCYAGEAKADEPMDEQPAVVRESLRQAHMDTHRTLTFQV